MLKIDQFVFLKNKIKKFSMLTPYERVEMFYFCGAHFTHSISFENKLFPNPTLFFLKNKLCNVLKSK
jgi:hypothetical protein